MRRLGLTFHVSRLPGRAVKRPADTTGISPVNIQKEKKMSAKRILFVVLVASAVMLAVGIGPRVAGSAQALPQAQEPNPPGVTIPYPGHLDDEAGQPVAEGAYDFTFALYETESGGEPLWTEAQEGVAVQGGAFTTLLGSVTSLSRDALDGGARWLEVAVRGPGEAGFTTLAPRQELSVVMSLSPAGPTAPTALSCEHTHFGEEWQGSALTGLWVQSSAADTYALTGYANHPTSAFAYGVYGYSANGVGVRGESYSGVAVRAKSVNGSGRDEAALRADNPNTNHGMAAYITNKSDYHTAHFDNSGIGGVLFLQNNGDGDGAGGFDLITAVGRNNDMQFRVISNGQARSDVGFTTPAEDFAEMLPAVAGLEPGDVLAIGSDGKLIRSTEPHQASVVGVYSTQPGFIGGQPVEGEEERMIPLAIVGVVPVKASAENGPITPGDLLVASSIPGHAMKAGSNPPQGTVIGKAFGSLDEGTGVIQMLVVLQ